MNLKKLNLSKGFTLVELIVVVAIIAVLSGVILFSTILYINKGKDSNIAGNLAVLVPAGEVYYNMDSTYAGFCDATKNTSVLRNSLGQMPKNENGNCYSPSITSTTNPAGVCCGVSNNGQAWAACAFEFTNPSAAICVDSRGVKKEITASNCISTITSCSN